MNYKEQSPISEIKEKTDFIVYVSFFFMLTIKLSHILTHLNYMNLEYIASYYKPVKGSRR